ncbi:MAG: PD40 domain-containing protein [Candidatus Eisenbacteria bacterium]|nr:PD40 domain-containing protein [Candidatus Eisenbacteria bacterium]
MSGWDTMRGYVRRTGVRGVGLTMFMALLLGTSAETRAILDDHLEPESVGQPAAPQKPAAPSQWFVDEPHGPVDTLRFEATEVTWASLDVHPGGRQILFDILGDLYTLPIEGGVAKRITSGPAYDYQARWSRDGARIVFTSDRGGVENIWTMNADGSRPLPLTEERDQVVNGPAWSPDGEYVIARKRLTDYSSLGRTELWMMHTRGGSGLQITRADDRPEVNEPVFSRDGRFVYFSNRPSRYRYDNNPYGGIFQIHRFDRVNGQFAAVTDGYGGAGRPTLSFDGRKLAFVRRDRLQTVLYLHDLETGRERAIWDGLDQDMQENFAFTGTYPLFSFTPDDRAIVIWAKGKLWRIDLASGNPTEIPFRAEVEQVITEALRFPRDIASDQFRVRMISWPTQAPDGKSLVFSAVGSLWRMPLPNGTPSRLGSRGGLAYAPSFSPDGKWLTYVTWSDSLAGSVWKMPAGGGSAVDLTTRPAQYANPIFSPDGRKIAFVRGDGAVLRGHDLSDEATFDLIWIDAVGGAQNYVLSVPSRGSARRMVRVFWNATSDRLFYIITEESGPDSEKSSLYSVQLDGTDLQEHLRFKQADEIVPSPDGRWVAYNEANNAFLVAMPQAGREPIQVNGPEGALPGLRFTESGGEWMNWADGGRIVTWAYGPNFYRAPLDSIFTLWDRQRDRTAAEREESREKVRKEAAGDTTKAEADSTSGSADSTAAANKVEGDQKDAEKKPELKLHPDTLVVDLRLPRARPSGRIALTHARLITMRAREVIEDGVVLLNGNRIEAAGPTATTPVPPGVRTLDLKGATIMPGMIDTHAHLHYSTLDILPEQMWANWCNLAYGVTTTHDPSASTYAVFTESEMIEAGVMKGPRTFSTGLILYGAAGSGHVKVDNLEDARNTIKRMKALGGWSVKSYMQPRREQRQMIIQAAREESVLVVPEGGGNLEYNCTHVLDGHTSNEHALPVAPIYDDVVRLFAASGTVETPTLLVAYGGLMGEHYFYQHSEVWKNEKLLRFHPRGQIDARSIRRNIMTIDGDWHHMKVAEGCRKIVEAGGHVSLGAHGQLQGLGPHWELWALTQGGMSNHDALRCATLTGAWELGLDRDLGSIEPGKLADLIVLNANPLDDIHNSESLRYVIKNGELFEAETMRQIWPETRPCHRFAFQTLGGVRKD